jgi:probable phosphoglycerate mutase
MLKDEQSPGIRILLIRHGETEWNRIRRFQGRCDIPLNEKGKDQARALALAVRDEPLVAIHSSPLTRALEMAQAIRIFHPDVPLIEEEGLLEMDLGDFDGMDAQQWFAEYEDFRNAWIENPATIKMPGGESLQEVQQRAVDTLERILQGYPAESTLLVSSHNFVNLTILCHALRTPLDRFRELKQETAALNILHKQGNRLRVVVLNERSHLER